MTHLKKNYHPVLHARSLPETPRARGRVDVQETPEGGKQRHTRYHLRQCHQSSPELFSLTNRCWWPNRMTDLSKYAFIICWHQNLINFISCYSEEDFWPYSFYNSMLNFESLLGPHDWFGGQNLEYPLYIQALM